MIRLANILICLLLGLAGSAHAQPVPANAGGAADTGQGVVPTELTLKELRQALVAAEDEIYEVFNRLNSDDAYDIICQEEKRINTHFKTRVCKARFLREAMSDEARQWADGDGFFSARQNHEYHSRVLQQKMRNLAAAHPELRAALKRHRDLQRAYDAAMATGGP